MNMTKYRSHGFTLIELMIALAVLGIITAIAYPGYQDQVRKTKRTDAIIALTEAAQLQERWFTQSGSYTSDIARIGGSTSGNGNYTISVSIPTGATCSSGSKFYCYNLTATPQGTQANDNTCKNFSLNHTGKKEISGTGSASDCW